MISWLRKFLNGNTDCMHEWEVTFADRITLAPKERRCKKCGAIQIAHTTWLYKG